MQPGQAPTPQHNPYGFIFEDKKAAKKGLLPSGSMKNRILVVLGGALVLLIAVILLVTLLGGNKSNSQSLVTIAEEQTELIRVANIGIIKASGGPARNLAQTTALSVTTSQQQVLALLKKLGQKPNEKLLALKKDATTDQQLDAAALNNSFDDTFIKTMQSELTTYISHVKQAYDATSSKSQKQVLATAYNGARVLSVQSN